MACLTIGNIRAQARFGMITDSALLWKTGRGLCCLRALSTRWSHLVAGRR